jgi:two-component sensor histidine kinase
MIQTHDCNAALRYRRNPNEVPFLNRHSQKIYAVSQTEGGHTPEKEGYLRENSSAMPKTFFLICCTFFLTLLPCLALFLWYVRRKNAVLKEKEKEVVALLKELHHRTRNNLQDITSMLHLQTASTRESGAKETLNSAVQRMEAFGLLHRYMYREKKRFTAVSLAEYTSELTEYLKKTGFQGTYPPVFHLDLESFYLEMDEAMHIGMALYEVLYYRFRQVCAQMERPELWISLKKQNGAVQVRIKDHAPRTAADETDTSFGLQLAQLLVQGSEGQLEWGQQEVWFSVPVFEAAAVPPAVRKPSKKAVIFRPASS